MIEVCRDDRQCIFVGQPGSQHHLGPLDKNPIGFFSTGFWIIAEKKLFEGRFIILTHFHKWNTIFYTFLSLKSITRRKKCYMNYT